MISESSAPYTDQLLSIDPGTAVQGHVGQNIKQVFIKRLSRKVYCQRLKMEAMEFIFDDQFGNEYYLLRAMLFDGDMYDSAQWIKPSMLKAHGGFTDSLMDTLRDESFIQLGRANVEILKARQNTNPHAIEPKDMATFAANIPLIDTSKN